ncbi:MAG: tyrosine-type recombinase/integrase, partial [Chloroflexota bacterium]
FKLIRPPKSKRLPAVLSRDEVKRVLIEVKKPVYHVCLTTIYSCGLRTKEGMELRPSQIDTGRMKLHLAGTKGGNERAALHSLHHSYTTHLLESGVNIRQIQTYLGHSSLQTTMIYTHLTSIRRD